MSSPSTTTWPAATPSGWARSTASSASRSAASCTGSTTTQRREAYAADVTYGTNNEFGFDYLRDNMKFRLEEMVQRPFNYAIVDEVDFDPDRRGAHAADHFRPDRGQFRALQPGRQAHPGARARGFREGREAAHRRADRIGRREDRGDAAQHGADDRRHALRHPQRRARPSRQPGAARAQAVRARHRLHRQGRQDHHHRRVHRPHDGGPALFGRPAPGARGEGRRHRPEREPDARLDHLPELFPPLPEARRHDRHGDDRGEEFGDIYKLDVDRDPDQRAGAPRRHRRRGLPLDRARNTTRSCSRCSNAASASSRCWSAPSASKSRRRWRRSSRRARCRTTC